MMQKKAKHLDLPKWLKNGAKTKKTINHDLKLIQTNCKMPQQAEASPNHQRPPEDNLWTFRKTTYNHDKHRNTSHNRPKTWNNLTQKKKPADKTWRQNWDNKKTTWTTWNELKQTRMSDIFVDDTWERAMQTWGASNWGAPSAKQYERASVRAGSRQWRSRLKFSPTRSRRALWRADNEKETKRTRAASTATSPAVTGVCCLKQSQTIENL